MVDGYRWRHKHTYTNSAQVTALYCYCSQNSCQAKKTIYIKNEEIISTDYTNTHNHNPPSKLSLPVQREVDRKIIEQLKYGRKPKDVVSTLFVQIFDLFFISI